MQSEEPPPPIIFRKEYINGRNFFPGNCMTGQLVADGVSQQVANGNALREAYPFIPRVPTSETVYLRSDDYPRTVQVCDQTIAMWAWFVHVVMRELSDTRVVCEGVRSLGDALVDVHM